MYGHVLGASTTVAGIGVLPFTGGNTALTIAAIVSIVIGGSIVLSGVVRLAAKKFYRA